MLAGAIVLGLWLAPCFSSADSPSAPPDAVAKASAARTFAEAVKRYRDGDAEGALPLFSGAYETTQSPNAELYVGYCLRDLRRLPEAHHAFTVTLEQTMALADNRYDETRDAAEAELLKLNLRVAKLIVSFVDAPADLNMTLDDAAVEPSQIGSPIVLEPGVHRIQASASGRMPILREVAIGAGGSKTLTLSLVSVRPVPAPLSVAATPQAPEAAPLNTPTDHSATLRLGGIVAAGVGLAGMGVFAYAGLRAKSLHDELRSDCPTRCSDATHRSDANRGESFQTAANVGLAVGGAGLVGGAILYYLGYRGHGRSEATWIVQPGSVAFSYRRAF